MRLIVLVVFLGISLSSFAQPQEATLLGTWNDSSIPGSFFFDNPYNEVWGLAINDREIAVIASTRGTHFIDVTDPTNPVELTDAFVPGAEASQNVIHRDYHDYNGYLYAVCDEGQSTLQIIDISSLPDSTIVVYDSDELFRTSHNIFIDSTNALLYACATRSVIGIASNVKVISIEDPVNPVLINNYNDIPRVHDIYVENNIAYANCEQTGLLVIDSTDPINPIVLGSMTTYPQQGYNHSGWKNNDSDHYYMADETWDTDLKVVDVSDFDDMSVLTTFNAEQTLTTIPHNLIVRCDQLYVSYYYDGLQIYDISDPANPVRTHFYDTSTIPNTEFYEGAWGVYPFLPSGNILVSDMQNGLFVFEAVSTHECENLVATENPESPFNSFKIYPQPALSELKISIQSIENQDDTTFQLVDIMGRVVQSFPQQSLVEGENEVLLLLNESVSSGMYFLQINNGDWSISKKVSVGK